MTLLALRYFCVAARYESISKAAGKLMLSQPALSKTIKGLESELGVSLFDRRGSRLSLTRQGRDFYNSVSQALELIDKGIKATAEPAGHKEIRVSVNAADLFMETIISSYSATHSDVFFILLSDTAPNRQNADVMIYTAREQELRQPSPLVHLLFTERFGVCLPKDDPLAQAESVDLLDLRHRDFIGTDIEGVNRQFCRELGFEPHLVLVGQKLHTYLEMLRAHRGISIMPEHSMAPHLPDTCVFVPLRNPLRCRTVALAENPSSAPAPHVHEFVRYCIQQAAALSSEGLKL